MRIVAPEGTHRRRDDRGDTLLEVLIAIAIIALAVGPLLGALIESLASSAEHRGLATVNTLLESFAETAASGVELSPPSGAGTLSGTTATSNVLFSAGTTFKGDGIVGAGIPSTTTITAETPSAHTATLSAAVTTESTETLSIVLFRRCATSYALLSRPSTSAGPPGTIVTVFGTGFASTRPYPLSTFSVKVGTTTAPRTTTTWVRQSQPASDRGNMEVTFKVPSGLTPSVSPRPIVLSGPAPTGGRMSVGSLAGEGFTVAGGAASRAQSPDARYRLGIVGITYWNPTTGTFGSSCTPSTQTGRSGVQLVTLSAAPGSGGASRLSFVLRDSSYFATLVPRPTVLVTGKDVALPYTGGPQESLVFTAAVTPPATNPAPSGTVAWTLTAPTGAHPACTSTSQSVPGGKTLVSTCKLQLTTASHVGLYDAVASYSGDAYNQSASGSGSATVYAPDGSGTMTVVPTAVLVSSTDTLQFTYTPATGGTGNGQVDVVVPTGWTAPQTTTAALPGYTTASGGGGADAVTVTGRTIEVSGVTLTATAGQKLTVTVSEVAPSARGRSTFTTSELSTAGGTLTALRSGSPVVVVTVADTVVTGASATTGKTVVTPSFTMTSGSTYLVYVFSSLSGTGDAATPTAAGFTSPPTFTEIGTQEKFDATRDNAWVWYAKGTGGTGKITVTLHNTIHEAYLEVVQLVGNGTPPYVTQSKGFHVATAAGTTALATLSRAPTSATDPEVVFLATEASVGTSAPAVPGFLSTASGFAQSTQGSFTVYTGLSQQATSIPIPSNWWGTVALEING